MVHVRTLWIHSQNVHVGDTLAWYIRRIGDGKVFPMEFEMGWSSLMRNQSSGPFIQNGALTAALLHIDRCGLTRMHGAWCGCCSRAVASAVSKGARFMWATEAEAYFSVSNSSNYDWLPQSPYNVWDIVIKDQDGNDVTVPWKCEQEGGIALDCNWKSPEGKPGISMSFAQTAMNSDLEFDSTRTLDDDRDTQGVEHTLVAPGKIAATESLSATLA